jgi:hypothetical protein
MVKKPVKKFGKIKIIVATLAGIVGIIAAIIFIKKLKK